MTTTTSTPHHGPHATTSTLPEEEPQARILGIPIDVRGVSEPAVRLRMFDPENPDLLVPRAAGVGWDLNFGALAVRLGLIRHDDSPGDLTAHIPPALARTLPALPVVAAAATSVAALAVAARHDRLPTGFTATFLPKGDDAAWRALLPPLTIAWGAAAWSVVTHRRSGIDLVGAAGATGLGAMTTALVAATGRAATRRGRRSLLAGGALLSYPILTGGIIVATLKAALVRLKEELRAAR
ncbi:MAG: DUF5808 domain-containing protein [Bowdeniella nasicola]|nr:DUF5808 domain-containing protein [Bowdeniella nasicola]